METAVDAHATSTGRRREHRAWYWYDWANSAYITTTSTVIASPYLTAVAKAAACPDLADGQTCTTPVSFLGFSILPGSLMPIVLGVSTFLSAFVLVVVGAIADRSPRPTNLLAGFAWAGSVAAAGLFLATGTNWQLGVALVIFANMCMGASLVVYDALLCRIAEPDERDGVSSRGWAFGYAGGGLLLAINLVFMLMAPKLDISDGLAARISMLSAAIWWAGFTVIPVLGLRHVKGAVSEEVASRAGTVRGSFGQLARTLRELRTYPNTLLFLVAYLFYNDGIQTVITNSSLYGTDELGFKQDQVLQVFLLVQFVALGGALLFGKIAARVGAWRTVLYGIAGWFVTVVIAFFTPSKQILMFALLGVLIGIVMGGTQALSRSLFSQLVPRNREAEFFSLYQAMERGTSWIGSILFGVVYGFAHSYRYSIIALILFFAVGGFLLARVDMKQGIIDAGNELPAVI
jgi:UMF1 family MFS transporter